MVPLSFIGSLAVSEVLLIAAVALMIFGSRLPEVAMRATAHVMRARRAVSRMWREAGLEQELRRVQREIETSLPKASDFEVPYDYEAAGDPHVPPPALSSADASDATSDPSAVHPEEGLEHEAGLASSARDLPELPPVPGTVEHTGDDAPAGDAAAGDLPAERSAEASPERPVPGAEVEGEPDAERREDGTAERGRDSA